MMVIAVVAKCQVTMTFLRDVVFFLWQVLSDWTEEKKGERKVL